MTRLVYCADTVARKSAADLDIYLRAAAKIVETVAFEIATKAPAASVEEMLGLASGIERAAAQLRKTA